MNKLEKTNMRVLAVEMLRSARRFYKLIALSEILNLDTSVISRYTTGQTLPSYDQAQRIINILREKIDLSRLVLEEAQGPNGMIDPTLPLMDKNLLRLIAIEFYLRLKGKRITKILVPETSGVVLATAVSMYLDADVIVARKRKTSPHIKWIEAHVTAPPNINRSFYIPYHSLRRSDKVIIVDDFVRSGYTLSSMLQLLDYTGASLVGILSLIVFGEEWKRVSGVEDVTSIVRISEGKLRLLR